MLLTELDFLTFEHNSRTATKREEVTVLTVTTNDVPEIDAALDEIRDTHPHAAEVLSNLYAPHRAAAYGDWLTTGQAAEVMGCTPQTIRNWVDAGWLPVRRGGLVGTRRLIDGSALADLARFREARGRMPRVREEDAAEALQAHRRANARTPVGGGT